MHQISIEVITESAKKTKSLKFTFVRLKVPAVDNSSRNYVLLI